jgi:DNA-binding LytR/AlgR family response regulator
MSITCLILDDDPAYTLLISSYVKKAKELTLSGVYNDPDQARVHLTQEDIQLMFIDMEMPGITGIDFVKTLDEPPIIIFITSHLQYAYESYNTGALDYLSKPLDENRFKLAISKVFNQIEMGKKVQFSEHIIDNFKVEEDYFVIRTGSNYIKIRFADVVYIEAMADFIKIHLDKQVHIALSNLKNIEKILPTSLFLRVHRSFIVNKKHIDSIGGMTINIRNVEIPLGESFKEVVMSQVVGNRLLKR